MSLKTPFLIFIITLLWGYTWVTMKMGLSFMAPLTFTSFRFLAGTLVMFVFLYIKKIGIPSKQDMPFLIILGLFQIGLNYFFVMYGMQFVGAGKSSILFYTMPIFSMILSYFFLKESLTTRKVIGVIIGLAGLILIMGWDFFDQRDLYKLMGEALILCGAVAFAVANMIVKRKFNQSNMYQITAWQMLFGTIGLFAAALIFEWGQPVQFNTESIFSILFSGIFGGAICFLAWYSLLVKIDSTVASMSVLFVPVLSLIFGWLQLGEVIGLGVIMGVGLIFISVYLVNSVQASNIN